MAETKNVTSKKLMTALFNQIDTSWSPPAVRIARSLHPTKSEPASLEERAEESAKAAILALHFLFPHEILPALDLLDRKLVSMIRWQSAGQITVQSRPPLEVFYVQSASAVTEHGHRGAVNSRYRNAWSSTKVRYEVRLDAWNCTCAAFAQSQLKLLVEDVQIDCERSESTRPNMAADLCAWIFGGAATNSSAGIPVCKHILAVAICTAAPGTFADVVERKDASIEELAAWCAGWGDS